MTYGVRTFLLALVLTAPIGGVTAADGLSGDPAAIADARAMVESMGWYTPVFASSIAYTFFGLDELARQLQEPFLVNEPNALALSAMCRVMEMDVCEALQLPVVPTKLVPGPDAVLM